MRWWLLAVMMAAASVEGIWLVNLPVYGVRLPLVWLALLTLLIEGWVSWRQSLVLAVLAGYWLDVLAAPVAGSALIPLTAAASAASVILLKRDYSQAGKMQAFVAGSLIYLSGSLWPGPYWPSWAEATVASGIYLVVLAMAYWIMRTTINGWKSRI